MSPARSAASAARVVYIGIVASTLIISGGALTTSLTLGTATAAVGPLDWLALVAGSAALLTAFRQRKRLSQSGGGRPAEEWWVENAGRVLLIWGLLELVAAAGAVLVFLTGHLTAFAALALLGLGGLGTFSPGKVRVR